MIYKWVRVLVLLALGGVTVGSCSDKNDSRLIVLPDANSEDESGETAGERGGTLIVDAVRDSSINELEPNQNYGLSPWLAIGNIGREHALVTFDSEAILEALESREFTSANIEFRIAQSPINWGNKGGSLGLYALTEAWTEWGVSWHCSNDTNPGNSDRDCIQEEEWRMGTPDTLWDAEPVATAHIVNGQEGLIRFDVSDSLQERLAAGSNYGWILMRDEIKSSNEVSETSSGESSSANGTGNHYKGHANNGSPDCDYGETPDDVTQSCLNEPWDDQPVNDLVLFSAQSADGPKLLLSVRSSAGRGPGDSTERGPSTPSTFVGSVDVHADNRVRESSPRANYGSANLLLSSGGSSNRNHSIVRVGTASIEALLGRRVEVAKAELVFEVSPSTPSFQSAVLSIHRMQKNWSETGIFGLPGASWHNPGGAGSLVQWNMATGGSFPHPTYKTAWTSTAWVSGSTLTMDVTADVKRFLLGYDNYGWVIKNSSGNGVWLYSREDAVTANRPKLNIYIACDAQTDAEFCSDNSATCGPLTAIDNCGDIRKNVDCGSCTTPDSCGGGGQPNSCGCTPTTCEAQGADCGTMSDGCGGTLDCGNCTGTDSCSGGGQPNSCGCTPTSCTAQGVSCGTTSDACGNTLYCGSCIGSDTCGGGGTPGICACTPITCQEAGLTCGNAADGCGAILTCGSCSPPVLSAIGDQSFDLGTELWLQLAATSTSVGTISYSVLPQPLPDNASLDTTSGVFHFAPSDGQTGDFTFSFGASDSFLQSEETVVITVNPAPAGTITSFSGRLLDTNDFVQGTVTPIVGATVSFLGTGTTSLSDINGDFVVTGVPFGGQVLDIDTSTAQAGPGGATYAGFREAIHIIDGVANIIERPFYMPRIYAPSLTQVVPSETTFVTNAALGVSIVVPPFTAKNPDGSDFEGFLSISLVPEGLAPAAMPSSLMPSMVVTVQPVGVTFATPVEMTYPNLDGLAAGNEINLWSIDPNKGQFVVVGTGEIAPDQQSIETIAGGVRASDWHFFLAAKADSVGNAQNSCPDTVSMGSTTTLDRGSLQVGYSLPSYTSSGSTQELQLVYTSAQAAPRAVVESTTTIRAISVVPDSVDVRLSIGTTKGPAIHTDTQGLSEFVDESFAQASGVDTSVFPTGIHDFTLNTTSHFGVSSVTERSEGTLSVVNQRSSKVGAGWSVAGVSRLHARDRRSALIVDGSGGSVQFEEASDGTIDIVEDGWILSRTVPFSKPMAASLNPVDGLLYVGRREEVAAGGGLYRIELDGSETFLGAIQRPSSIVIDPSDGDVFVSEDSNGSIYYWPANGPLPPGPISIWEPTFPVSLGKVFGMAIAPDTYSGKVVAPGEAVVVDRSQFGFNDVWSFSVDTDDSLSSVLPKNAAGNNLQNVLDVAIGQSEIFLSDTHAGINRLGPGAILTPLVTAEPVELPFGIATDPTTQDLLVLDRGGQRLVRIDPFSGTMSVVFEGFAMPNSPWILSNPNPPGGVWASLDISPDGTQIFISDGGADLIYTFTKSTSTQNQPLVPSKGDFSSLVQNLDLTWTRSFPGGQLVQFDAQGLQTSKIDANGNTTLYTYDTLSRLETITDAVGLTTTFTYGTDGKLESITDPPPASRVTNFAHDAAGNLTQITAPDATTRNYVYDSQHRMTSQISELGLATSYYYDSLGRNTESRWPDGSTRELISTQMVGLIDTGSGIGTSANPATLVREDELVAIYTDAEKRDSLFTVDQLGRLTSATNPAGYDTIIDRTEEGQVERLELPSGHAFSSTFDPANGNQLSSLDETTGGATSSVYNTSFNTLDSTTTPDGTTNFTYDGTNLDGPNLTGVTSPGGLSDTFIPDTDDDGKLLSSTGRTGVNVQYFYDDNDNLKEIRVGTAPNERVTLFGRDDINSAGQISTITDALLRVSTIGYDSIGQATTFSNPNEETTAITYNTDGSIETITPPGRTAHLFEYTKDGQLETYTPPSVSSFDPSTHYSYNSSGQLIFGVFPDGKSAEIKYDTAGRLDSVESPEENRVFTYRPDTGQIDTIANAAGTLSFGYRGSLNETMSWSYGLTSGTVTGHHDELYRLDDISVDGFASIPYIYNADGQLTSFGDIGPVTYNGTTGLTESAIQVNLVDNWDYNSFAELDHYDIDYNSNELFRYDLVMDDLGRIESSSEIIAGIDSDYSYLYDLSDRLEEVYKDGILVEKYSYDSNGNRTKLQTPTGPILGSYDAQDRITAYGATSYTYTNAGALATKTTPTGTTAYEYGTLGALRAVTLEDGTQIDYIIDVGGRRVGKRVNGVFERGWIYKDHLNPVAEFDSSGVITSFFVYGFWPHIPDYIVRSDGSKLRIISDRRGSPRLVVDVATGTVLGRRDFNSFGQVLTDTNPELIPFGFAGGLYDPDTKLTLFGARDYDAEIGRWTSKDPILLGDGGNLYLYSGADPVNNIDLNGEFIDSMTNACMRAAAFCATSASLAAKGARAAAGKLGRTAQAVGRFGGRAKQAVQECIRYISRGNPNGIRQAIKNTPEQVRNSGAVHNIIDGGRTLVVTERHLKHSWQIFTRYNGQWNLFRKEFWQHILPHRHVYELASAPETLNANWRKTWQNLHAVKRTIWRWE